MDKIITDLSILHQISKETTWKEVKKLNLRARLEEAMKAAWTPGIGLAAIQIGIPLRYAWYKFPKEGKPGEFTENELLNPTILTLENPFTYSREGCCSIPGYWAQTRRYLGITLINDERQFATERLEAVVIQHEIGHMDGVLTVDIELEKYKSLGRNEPCGCGSGRKYKKCCLR